MGDPACQHETYQTDQLIALACIVAPPRGGVTHGLRNASNRGSVYDRRVEDVPHPSRLAAWVRAVGVLALPADQQATWLDSLGPVAAWNVGELGLEFDDGYVLLDQWVRAGWVDQKSLVPIAALNTRLDEMSGERNAALWTRQALAQHQAWREIRELATAVLVTIA